MKANYLSLAFIALVFFGCQEVGPKVDIDGTSNLLGDTTYLETSIATPQPRVVVIEEFTGVRCVNCPRAHATIKTIQEAHPGRVAAVGIHTGIFAQPYEGRQDFQLRPEGNDIESLLGNAQGYPSGAVDRELFPGESRIIINDTKWSNYVNSQLTIATPVNIELVKVYNPVSRKFDINATFKFTSAVAQDLYFTAYLCEDNIREYQLTPTGIDSSYTHNHVLRKVITPVNGQRLNAPSFIPGRVIVQRFSFVIPESWNASNLKLVGLVHGAGDDKGALHGAYTRIE